MKLFILSILYILANINQSEGNKISINPVLIDPLEESQTHRISLTLDSPIICENPHVLCNVVLRFTNPSPNEISIRPCLLEWSMEEWEDEKYINIMALEDFVNDGNKEIRITTENIISNAVYYRDVNPEDIIVRTRSRPTGHCSSTGDPHLTTFDGYHYHFYGRGYVRMVQSTENNFEVQAITHGGGYSRNCAVAVRNKNDLVIMDACDGSFEITERITSTGNNKPRLYRRGSNQYFVDFSSGARVKTVVWGNNMNVYIDVPGAFWGNTQGMCGTFDGNSGNEGNPSYIIHNYHSLPNEWKVTSQHSLWNWYPEEVETTTESSRNQVIETNSHSCEYELPIQWRPILSYGNIEDITELITNNRQEITDRKNYTFIPREDDEPIPNTISSIRARELCQRRFTLTDDSIQQCSQVDNINRTTFVENCIEDVIVMGDEQFIDNAYHDFIQLCEEELVKNEDILRVRILCIDGCSIHGRCVEGKCICNEHFTGSNCMVNMTEKPTIHQIYPYECDITDMAQCGEYIRINGFNFLNSSELSCIYFRNDTLINKKSAKYLGYSVVLCPIPQNDEMIETSVIISVVNFNHQINTTNILKHPHFIWRDFCKIYDKQGNYEIDGNTCYIDIGNSQKKCVHQGEHSIENDCKLCNPRNNKTIWSYNTTGQCQPYFSQSEIEVYIIEEQFINETIQLIITNNYHIPLDEYDDMIYGYNHSYPFISIDENEREVHIQGTFNYEEQQEYNIYIWMKNKNNGRIIDTSLIRLRIEDSNEYPITQENQSFNFTYDLHKNVIYETDIISIQATDPDIFAENNDWHSLTYSLSDINEPNIFDLFVIDRNTGVISIHKERMLTTIRNTNTMNDREQPITFHLFIIVSDNEHLTIETEMIIIAYNTNYEWIINTSVATTEKNSYPTADIETTHTSSTIHMPQNRENSTYTTTIPSQTSSTENVSENIPGQNLEEEVEENVFPTDAEFVLTDKRKSSLSRYSCNTNCYILIIIVSIGIAVIIFTIIKLYYKISIQKKTMSDDRCMIENPLYGIHHGSKEHHFNDNYNDNIVHQLNKEEWYTDTLMEKDIQDILINKGQGAFMVSKYPDNNYFMIVKYNNKLVKQDIIYNKFEGYYLYNVENQPHFKTLQELVKYYIETNTNEFHIILEPGMPDYDNHLLKNNRNNRNNRNNSINNDIYI